MPKTLDIYEDFTVKIRYLLLDGDTKYQDSYLTTSQADFIREKINRYYGKGQKAKNPEDILKIAAYTYLWYRKETLPPPRKPKSFWKKICDTFFQKIFQIQKGR